MNSLNESQIDEAILSVTPATWVKVAFVVGMVDRTLPEGIDLDLIAERIESLIQGNRLVAQGNVKKWRHSEVRRCD